ncbi:fumarate reductase subunit D [Idiomarina sp. A28L]|uniref:fumarate reductase subunit FrdD n=1 Tax=Idiomarina sp. A28L TaxID=1036674 RepID=UPI0002138D2A|nr:fumarate reductase subunit FrdD [Idiomarina sp. A28L]EGN75475.1 fumarate reductase subunit D [Idiomarina sp. A28L]
MNANKTGSRWQGLHLEPLWWGLFSAGGVCFAVFIPAVVLIFGIMAPLGIIDISYQQVRGYYASIWGLMFTGAVICLPAFHAAHRIRHGLHDVKLGGGLVSIIICYGLAATLSATTLAAWYLLR